MNANVSQARLDNTASIVPAIQAAGITPTGLKDLLLTVDAEASKTTVARIKVILDGLCNLPLTEGRKLLTETAKVAKGSSEEKTVKTRVSECRQLYGAVKLIEGFRKAVEEKGMGWSPAVSRARLELENAHIKPDGGPIKTPEMLAKARMEDQVKIMLEAEVISADGNDQRTVGELAKHAREQAFEVLYKADVQAHAERIGKAKGKDYCLDLADALMAWEPKEVQA